MRLAQLPYEKRACDGKVSYGITVPGRKKWVAQDHFNEVWKLFWSSADRLDPARKHTTKELCNDPIWQERPRGQRIAFGRCVRYLASHGVLPLTLANPGKSGARKYRLHKDLAPAPTLH